MSLAEHVSTASFEATLERLTNAIEKAGLRIFARIDHAAAAQDAGQSLPPTMVLIYGGPKGGTPIMQAVPEAALDLPLRVLVREAQDGRVLVSFHPAGDMLRELGVAEDLAERLEPAQQLLVDAIR